MHSFWYDDSNLKLCTRLASIDKWWKVCCNNAWWFRVVHRNVWLKHCSVVQIGVVVNPVELQGCVKCIVYQFETEVLKINYESERCALYNWFNILLNEWTMYLIQNWTYLSDHWSSVGCYEKPILFQNKAKFF